MSTAWDPTNADRLVAIGMADSAISSNGGRSWTPLQVPSGTSAATFSADGRTLYAAVLNDEQVTTFASTDSGQTWTRP
ncbi:MAG: hypothetical protein H0V32_01140 [Nocardioidaceae bacterium]|nr:hypothetical protein [Nocardioidaceae bacterium]